MSLARAFTTRKSKKVADISSPLPQRSNTTKHAFAAGTIRNKISSPVELLSTTNMLSYNAPDLFPSSSNFTSSPSPAPSSPPSLTHSSSSSTRSVSSSGDRSTATSPTTPGDERSPSPNHLSCYFVQTGSDNEDASAPTIPQRSPSHTKRTHEMLHRKRSISRMSQNASHSVKNSISSFTRDSLQMFSSTPELVEDEDVEESSDTKSRISHPSISSLSSTNAAVAPAMIPTTVAATSTSFLHTKKASHSQINAHPFGPELAQVTELAEEYASGVRIVDDEERDLLDRGFFKWDARDYVAEIEALYSNAFADEDRRSDWF